jgi:hypothetical protein
MTRFCSSVLAAVAATALFAPTASAADWRGGYRGGVYNGYVGRPFGPRYGYARPFVRPWARAAYGYGGGYRYWGGYGYGYRPVYSSPGLLAYPTPVYAAFGAGCGYGYGYGCGGWGGGWGYGYGYSAILAPVVAAPAITYAGCGGFGFYRGCW